MAGIWDTLGNLYYGITGGGLHGGANTGLPYNPTPSATDLGNVMGQVQRTQSTPMVNGAATDSGPTLQNAPNLSGGGTGAAPAPDLTPYKNEVNSRIGQLQGMYGQLFGNIDQNVADQRSQYDTGFNTQQNQLNNDYQGSMGQIGQIMAGRGLGDSSYLGDAQGQATNTYNTNLDSLNQGKANAYSSLGKFATTQKQALGAGQKQLGQYDLSQYTDPTSLMTLRNQLDQQLSTLGQTQAGLGTNAGYQSALQAATPAATQQGSAQLQTQLQKLKSSGASPLVTNQIAQGLIKSAGKTNDPLINNFWQSIQGA